MSLYEELARLALKGQGSVLLTGWIPKDRRDALVLQGPAWDYRSLEMVSGGSIHHK